MFLQFKKYNSYTKCMLLKVNFNKTRKNKPLGTQGSNNVHIAPFQRLWRWNNVTSTLSEPLCPVGKLINKQKC